MPLRTDLFKRKFHDPTQYSEKLSIHHRQHVDPLRLALQKPNRLPVKQSSDLIVIVRWVCGESAYLIWFDAVSRKAFRPAIIQIEVVEHRQTEFSSTNEPRHTYDSALTITSNVVGARLDKFVIDRSITVQRIDMSNSKIARSLKSAGRHDVTVAVCNCNLDAYFGISLFPTHEAASTEKQGW